MIFAKDTGWKNPWFDYLHKGNPILIISVDVIKTEQGLKIIVIISICKPDDGSWIKAKINAPKVFCHARWSLLMSRKHRDSFSKVHTSTFDGWSTICLVSRKTYVKDIQF
jgi:hypothetical protein